MCGRYVSTKSTPDLLDEFDAVDGTGDVDVEPVYNVAPTQDVRTVVNRVPRGADPGAEPVRQLRLAHWGLVPSWAKDRGVGNKMINARAESVTSKPAFKRAFAKRRCLIPADGWYEWQRDVDAEGKPRKQPFLMTPRDGHSVAFAGLYEFWKQTDADSSVDLLLSVTILTVPSRGELEQIHDRMPLVLDRSQWAEWLDPAHPAPTALLTPHDEVAEQSLELRPVSSKVNNVANDSPDLLDPVHPAARPLELF
jgi:putative SOS response-associated peptidase YedK